MSGSSAEDIPADVMERATSLLIEAETCERVEDAVRGIALALLAERRDAERRGAERMREAAYKELMPQNEREDWTEYAKDMARAAERIAALPIRAPAEGQPLTGRALTLVIVGTVNRDAAIQKLREIAHQAWHAFDDAEEMPDGTVVIPAANVKEVCAALEALDHGDIHHSTEWRLTRALRAIATLTPKES